MGSDNRKKKVILSTAGATRDGYIWLASCFINNLMKIDLDTGQCIKCYRFPEGSTENMFLSAQSYGDIVLFCPYNAHYCWAFDTKKEEFQKIELGIENDKNVDNKFSRMVILKNKAYFFGEKLHLIVELMLNSLEYRHIDCFDLFMNEKYSYAQLDRTQDPFIFGDMLGYVSRKGDGLFLFDMKDESARFVKLDGVMSAICATSYGDKGTIVVADQEDNIYTCDLSFDSKALIKKVNKATLHSIRFIKALSNRKVAVIYNMNNVIEVLADDYSELIPTGVLSSGQYPEGVRYQFCLAFSDNNQIIMQSRVSGELIIYEVEKGTRKVSLLISDSDICEGILFDLNDNLEDNIHLEDDGCRFNDYMCTLAEIR